MVNYDEWAKIEASPIDTSVGRYSASNVMRADLSTSIARCRLLLLASRASSSSILPHSPPVIECGSVAAAPDTFVASGSAPSRTAGPWHRPATHVPGPGVSASLSAGAAALPLQSGAVHPQWRGQQGCRAEGDMPAHPPDWSGLLYLVLTTTGADWLLVVGTGSPVTGGVPLMSSKASQLCLRLPSSW